MGTFRRMLSSCLILGALWFVGCEKVGVGPTIPEDATTLETEMVVFALMKHGVKLSPSQNDELTEKLILNGHEPKAYEIDDEARLYIYEFEDYTARKEAERTGLYTFHEKLAETGWVQGNHLNARNIVLLPVFSLNLQSPPKLEQIEELEAKWEGVADIVFEHINHGKTYVYLGEGKLWEGEIVQKSYLHWYEEDSNGQVRGKADGYTSTCGEFTYTGDRPEELVDMSYRVERGGSETFSKGRDATDGVISIGCSRTNSAVNHDKPVETMRFSATWGDQSDEFELERVMTDE